MERLCMSVLFALMLLRPNLKTAQETVELHGTAEVLVANPKRTFLPRSVPS